MSDILTAEQRLGQHQSYVQAVIHLEHALKSLREHRSQVLQWRTSEEVAQDPTKAAELSLTKSAIDGIKTQRYKLQDYLDGYLANEVELLYQAASATMETKPLLVALKVCRGKEEYPKRQQIEDAVDYFETIAESLDEGTAGHFVIEQVLIQLGSAIYLLKQEEAEA